MIRRQSLRTPNSITFSESCYQFEYAFDAANDKTRVLFTIENFRLHYVENEAFKTTLCHLVLQTSLNF